MLQKSKFLAFMIVEVILKDGPNQPASLIKPKEKKDSHSLAPHLLKIALCFRPLCFLKFMTGNTQFPSSFPFSDT